MQVRKLVGHRIELASCCSADRSYLHCERAHAQVKDVVDGDLCEQFPQMPADKQRAIAEELERTPGEVLKKLEDLRNALL